MGNVQKPHIHLHRSIFSMRIFSRFISPLQTGYTVLPTYTLVILQIVNSFDNILFSFNGVLNKHIYLIKGNIEELRVRS